MENKKRLSIRRQIQLMVLIIVSSALVISSIVSITSMLIIKQQASEAFTSRMEHNLINIVTNKAEIADSEFSRCASYAYVLTDYVHNLYLHPDQYAEQEVLPPRFSDGQKLTIKRYLANKEIKYEDVEFENKLLGNIEHVAKPMIESEKVNIVAIYISTESGLQISLDCASEISAAEGDGEAYFDYYGRPWYSLARDRGELSFTNVYEDSYNRGYMITCAAPYFDENNKFAGVISIDMLIEDVYSNLVDFDILDGDGDYAFMIDGNGYAVSPQYSDLNIFDDENMDADIVNAIMKGETGVRCSDAGYYFAYAPIESVGWKMCLNVPKSLILQPAKEIGKKIKETVLMFITIFVVIAMIIFAVVRDFAQNITEPLLALRHDAQEISNGNLEYKATIYKNDEIGDLAVSFNNMAISLKDYIANLTAVTAEKERIGAELEVATEIQMNMLPRTFPPFPDRKEFDLYAAMYPAKEVGGDFYDFFLLDEDHLCMVMADVSGKGVPAALFMVVTKNLIKNRAQLGYSPAEILAYANEQLCEGNETELFVTVWVAILEISTGKGIAANAGHEHPVIKRAGGDYELVRYHHSPVVAAMEGIKFQEHEFELHPGDTLFIYTDGVPEATNGDNELFGNDRMLEVLNANKGSGVEDILTNMKKSIDEFVGEASQFDDITMLVCDYHG